MTQGEGDTVVLMTGHRRPKSRCPVCTHLLDRRHEEAMWDLAFEEALASIGPEPEVIEIVELDEYWIQEPASVTGFELK